MMLTPAYKHCGIFINFFLCLTLLSAQSESGAGHLSPATNYYGWLDGKFPVHLNWENDGKNVEGYVYFGDKDSLSISGKYNNQKLVLTEKSAEGDEVGGWELEKKNNEFVGYWGKDDHSQNIVLRPKDVEQKFIFKKIKSNVTALDWQVILQSVSATEIIGTLSSVNNNQYFHLKGGWDNKGEIVLSIENDESDAVGLAWLPKKNAAALALQWAEEEAQFLNITTTDLSSPHQQLVNNKIAQIHFLYPQLDHKPFNDWLQEKIQPLWERANNYQQKVQQAKFYTGLRGRVRADAHCHINGLNDNFVCGSITYWDSWSAKKMEETFVFDLRKGEELKAEDLLKDAGAFKDFVKKKIVDKYKNEKEVLFTDWLKTAAVDQWSIRPNGIWWATDFHPIFGQAGILLDDKAMAPFVRPNTL